MPFTGVDEFAHASNAEHLSDKKAALGFILESPVVGYPFGFFAREDVITDGASFILFLEFGGPITILLYFFAAARTRRYATDAGSRQDFPLYAIYFLLLSSVINSSLIDKAMVPVLIFLLTSRITGEPTEISHAAPQREFQR